MRIIIRLIATLIVVVAGLYFFGPREPMSGIVTFNPAVIGDNLDNYFQTSEANYSDIRSGLEKEIIWNDPATRQKTDYSLVYVHGFSASKAEIRPVPDRVAEALNANLFYTRLRGHGRSPDAMAEPFADDWLNDSAEAIAIGERLGEKVIIIATSTGSTAITWLLAKQPELTEKIAGVVFVSPNYAIQAGGTFLFEWPFARTFVPLILGDYRVHDRSSDAERHGWTTPYSTEALMPLKRLVSAVKEVDVSIIKTPALFIYSPNDKVVKPEATKAVADKWGGTSASFLIDKSGDDGNHVIAGDIRSPQTTSAAVEEILRWISSL